MFAMAEDTGGEAFVNTNNLTQAVTKAVEDGSNYYTLTYSPTNPQWDGRFRAIKVKVEEQPGLKLSYRNGYFADDPNDRSKVVAGETAMASGPANTMVTAMMHGGPDPAEILFKVRIRPAAAPPEETPLANNQTNPDPKVKVEGPFKEYGVDLVPDAHAVSCPLDAGWHSSLRAGGVDLCLQPRRTNADHGAQCGEPGALCRRLCEVAELGHGHGVSPGDQRAGEGPVLPAHCHP